MSIGPIAKRYARAILELATEQGVQEQVGRELTELAEAWDASLELRSLFTNPEYSAQVRKSVLVELLDRAAVTQLTRNSVLYVSDRGRLLALPAIARVFNELAERAAGSVRAEVISAAPLPEAYVAQLQRALEQVTGHRVTIERKTDPSLIAGVVTRVGDHVFDGSIRTRLNGLKESLQNA
ncbi:MAG: F0F1 ATP synthase subunit delta [Polyangiales bacterium]